MKAVLVKEEYNDLVQGFPYTIRKIMRSNTYYIMVQGSPRRYTASSFVILHNDKRISMAEAYRRYRIESVQKKLKIGSRKK